MGYCYFSSGPHSGKLVCDICGLHPARKQKCPFGWCQPIAICADCKKTKPHYISAAWHREQGCEKNHHEFAQRQEIESSMLAAGKLVRCAALSCDHETGRLVHVLFKRQDQSCVGYYMRPETYHAIPLLTAATVEDYQKHGELLPAPSDFHSASAAKLAA